MKITEHFDSSEFDCNDGTPYPPMWYDRLQILCGALEKIRAYFNAPITITSGFRTKQHNEICGGKIRSKHLEGIAADFQVKGISPHDVFVAIYKRFHDIFYSCLHSLRYYHL
jgi:uncharacterized protein YcbK (DUF882 family)